MQETLYMGKFKFLETRGVSVILDLGGRYMNLGTHWVYRSLFTPAAIGAKRQPSYYGTIAW
jgi:hypothetical protein